MTATDKILRAAEENGWTIRHTNHLGRPGYMLIRGMTLVGFGYSVKGTATRGGRTIELPDNKVDVEYAKRNTRDQVIAWLTEPE